MPLPEKDYTYGEQLLLEGVKSTYGIPTVGLLAAGFTGFQFVSAKFDWFLKEVQEVKDEIIEKADELYQDAILRGEKIVNTVTNTVVPVTTFKSDAEACYESSKINIPFVGRAWVPPLSANYFTLCMGRKGYAGSTIQNFLSK